MRVLCLVPNQLGYSPGQRGSIELWEKVLTPEGIHLEFAPFENDELRKVLYFSGRNAKKAYEMARSYLERLRLLRELDRFDAVFVYREAALIGPALLERLVARKKPIIYQLDDPLFVPYKSQNNGYFSYLKFFSKIKEIIKMSKVVIVNSSHIRKYAEQFNSNIWQVPTVVDTDYYKYRPRPTNEEPLTLGWSGSPNTVINLEVVENSLRRLTAAGTCNIHLIGSSDIRLENVNFSQQKWNGETEIEDLRRLDIGMVPLTKIKWNEYKFIMKTAQYMSLGIVPIGTPIASNPEVIRHGENGFLAATDDDWVECVNLLNNDRELLRQMANEAAKDALEKYSLKAHTQSVIEAFRFAETN